MRVAPLPGPAAAPPGPTFVKTRHHCQCRSFRYAAQLRCRTFRALSCCCFLAKALRNRQQLSAQRSECGPLSPPPTATYPLRTRLCAPDTRKPLPARGGEDPETRPSPSSPCWRSVSFTSYCLFLGPGADKALAPFPRCFPSSSPHFAAPQMVRLMPHPLQTRAQEVKTRRCFSKPSLLVAKSGLSHLPMLPSQAARPKTYLLTVVTRIFSTSHWSSRTELPF